MMCRVVAIEVTIPQAVVKACQQEEINMYTFISNSYDTASGSKGLSTATLRSRMIPGL
jgi:hypothetical protein